MTGCTLGGLPLLLGVADALDSVATLFAALPLEALDGAGCWSELLSSRTLDSATEAAPLDPLPLPLPRPRPLPLVDGTLSAMTTS